MYQGVTKPLTIASAGPGGDCGADDRSWQGGMSGWLAGGPLLVEEEGGEGGGVVVGVEAEDGVGAATLLLHVWGLGGQPEPAADNETARPGEVPDDEGGQMGAERIDHGLVRSRGLGAGTTRSGASR